MNLFALFRDVNGIEEAIEYLRGKNIFHRRRVCRKGHDMHFVLDGKPRWACDKRCCLKRVGLRVDTWLAASRMPLENVVWFIYAWCQQYTTFKFCGNELLMSPTIIVDWKDRLRTVCAKSLLQNPTIVGGEGLTVEVRESCFTSKRSKVKGESQQQWVFGGVCRETSECFLYAVAVPTPETLVEAASAGVRPGSVIVSELFTSYGGSHLLPPHYTLLTIDKHQSRFTNPTTGEEEEALWCVSKRPKRNDFPRQRKGQDSYLCEFLWRKRHEKADLVEQIYKDIASLYPLKEAVE